MDVIEDHFVLSGKTPCIHVVIHIAQEFLPVGGGGGGREGNVAIVGHQALSTEWKKLSCGNAVLTWSEPITY